MFLKKSIVYILLVPVFFLHIYLMVALSSKIDRKARINIILSELAYYQDESDNVKGVSTNIQKVIKDERVSNLKIFFRKHNSDLYEYASFIVETSDKYELDYRLIPAIAMKESTLCKFIPKDSYNCWGWGIYGNKVTRFSSYTEAIETVAKGLKENYKDHGLKTVDQIMSKYNPSSENGSWAKGVNMFMEAMIF